MADYVKIEMPASKVGEPEEYVDKAEVRVAAEALWRAFAWDASPEGAAFWRSVARRLEQMAARGY